MSATRPVSPQARRPAAHALSAGAAALRRPAPYVGIALVWAYRASLGALFPTTCKYHPSCSQYAIDALRGKGLVRGSALAGWRLLRCNPWSRGGFDPVR